MHYLAISPNIVSSALVKEDGMTQHLIYYVSKSLAEAEIRYPKIRKLVLAFAMLIKKLCQYVQPHSIILLTNQPQNWILQTREASDHLVKWLVKLREFDI